MQVEKRQRLKTERRRIGSLNAIVFPCIGTEGVCNDSSRLHKKLTPSFSDAKVIIRE